MKALRFFVAVALGALPGLVVAQTRSAHVPLDRGALDRLRATSVSGPEGGAVIEAPFEFTAIAALQSAGSDGELWVRTSRDGRAWSSAIHLPDDEPNSPYDEQGRAHRFGSDRVSALHFAPAASARFVSLEIRNARTPAGRVTLHFIDARSAGDVRNRVLSRTSDDPAAPHPLKPQIIRRDAWGARPSKYAYSFTLAGHLAFHHTAGVSDGLAATTDECAAQVRAIQVFHQESRGWNDVGYSYLVCGTGEVFQGREDDEDETDVWGAHDGFNRGSMSVSLLGYFHPPYSQTPTGPMMESLVRTLAWMSDLRGIDPLEASLYEAFGAVRTNIYGHREVRATDCPGNLIFARKDEIRFRVAEILSEYRAATSLRRH